MAAAGGVLGQQDVAGMDGEGGARHGLELERAGQGDHELPGRCLMRGVGATRPGFPEGDAGDDRLVAQHVATLAIGQVDRALLEQRVAVRAVQIRTHRIMGALPFARSAGPRRRRTTSPPVATSTRLITRSSRRRPTARAAVGQRVVEAALGPGVAAGVQEHLHDDRLGGALNAEVARVDRQRARRCVVIDLEALGHRHAEHRRASPAGRVSDGAR